MITEVGIPIVAFVAIAILYCFLHIKRMEGKEAYEITVAHVEGFLRGVFVGGGVMGVIALIIL